MNGLRVKETMERIHITPKMQEEIMMNVQKRMGNGKKRTWSFQKAVAVAVTLVLMAGIISVPVHAIVKSLVKERMEAIPQEELQVIKDTVQGQDTQADGFTRAYSDQESARFKELWQLYKQGTFPEKEILQVDNAEAVTEGTLCYIKATGVFYLPDRELTDEEMLEIIDFQHIMSYSFVQSPAAQEARAEMEAEQNRLEQEVRAAGGISEEQAIEIARKQMESEIGARAQDKELMTDVDGCGAQLEDISDQTAYAHKGNIAYNVGFGNPDDKSTYTCLVDAVDGSILYTVDYTPN